MTNPILDTRPRVRAERALRQWIADGVLPMGERLPTEVSLAKRLKVSRPTLRLAIRPLKAEGLIAAREDGHHFIAAKGAAHAGVLAHTAVVFGCAFPNGEPGYQRSSGWDIQRQHGVLGALRETGFDAMIVDEHSLTIDKVRRLTAGRPRGVIAVDSDMCDTAAFQEIAGALRVAGLPVVSYGSQPIAGCDRVSSDHAAGCYELTRWLIAQGRRRILRVWTGAGCGVYRAWMKERDAGYEKAMREVGIDILPAVWPGLPDLEILGFEARTRSAAGWLVEHLQRELGIDAILAASDGEVYPIAAACRLLGKTPGRDLLIAGYDDYWMDSPERQFESCMPAATVDKRNPVVGQELVKLLQDRLAGKLPAEPQHRLLKPKLVIPESGRKDG